MKQLKITCLVSARIPTETGVWSLNLYNNDQDDKEHLAFILGDIEDKSDVMVRIHSECFTGDVLGSRRCDCGEQLHKSIYMIAEAGCGVLIYLRQEGRGIGLLEKLRAYNLQEQGYDTVDANLVLGHQEDERDYTIAGHILDDLGVMSVSLLTNNPHKIEHLIEMNINVEERIPIEPTMHGDNAAYLTTKALRMGHLLNIESQIRAFVPEYDESD